MKNDVKISLASRKDQGITVRVSEFPGIIFKPDHKYKLEVLVDVGLGPEVHSIPMYLNRAKTLYSGSLKGTLNERLVRKLQDSGHLSMYVRFLDVYRNLKNAA